MNIKDYIPTLEIIYAPFASGFEIHIIKYNQRFKIAFAGMNYFMNIQVYDSLTDSNYYKKSKRVNF